MKAHVIENSEVVDTIVVDDLDFEVGEGRSLIDGEEGGIGWRYENGELIAPAVQVVAPQVVTRRQGRLALHDLGKLDQVEAAIEAIADDDERTSARIEYEADTWERSNDFLSAMWAQLGGSESELDALFLLASEK